MVKGDLIKSGNFEKIEELTKEAVKVVKEIRG
jgi:2-dehydro-3-deoxyphosphogluconate aldolase/(4S)-4-hydroxy-2-oxoglutarate aldolase